MKKAYRSELYYGSSKFHIKADKKNLQLLYILNSPAVPIIYIGLSLTGVWSVI
jgi:hypothetical protein